MRVRILDSTSSPHLKTREKVTQRAFVRTTSVNIEGWALPPAHRECSDLVLILTEFDRRVKKKKRRRINS